MWNRLFSLSLDSCRSSSPLLPRLIPPYRIKQKAKDNGGTIVNEFTLVKGFTVSYPKGHVNVLSSDEHVDVEADSEVSTQ